MTPLEDSGKPLFFKVQNLDAIALTPPRDSPSAAEAVETHVHVETAADDDFARKLLDMSEQTCFLHALCRESLQVDARALAG